MSVVDRRGRRRHMETPEDYSAPPPEQDPRCYVLAGVVLLSLVRVLSGAQELTSSGTLRVTLTSRCRSRSPASAGCGPSGPGS